MRTAFDIEFGGEALVLNADKTLWWPREKTLFAADLHAGKTEHMRRYGLAIPGGSLEADLARLHAAAKRHNAKRLLFLGDLFHSEHNAEWETFAGWCRAQPFAVDLVRGNHDRFLSDEQFEVAGMQVYPEPYLLAPFALRHHPAQELIDLPVLAGHVHPVYWTGGVGRDRLRSPCFWIQQNQLILPAFGSFTGGYAVHADIAPEDHIYVCSQDGTAIIAAR